MSRKERMAALDDAIGTLGSARRGASGAVRSMVPIVNQIETVFQDSAAELERLQRNGQVLLELDVGELRTTRFRDRHAAAFQGAAFDELVQDILQRGQLVPILVRPSSDGSGYDIVAGHRRVEACRRLGRKVLARRIAADDRELLVAMVRENETREDISPFERAVQIRSVIDSGLMTRQELMEALSISKGHLSSLLKFAELPVELVEALGDPRILTIADGAQLARQLTEPEARLRLRGAIDAIRPSDPPADRLRHLRRALAGRPQGAASGAGRPSDRVIRSRTGQVLVRLADHDGRPILRLAAGIPPEAIDRLFEQLPRLLQKCGLDVAVEPAGD
ncbi:ParB/RepB/Spo0J family partition protein [Benzoatithermus flavus]|uniref:ParB/RepB/Spo0J family partition protein n=1 Tax=Benzoatithermus flavus TaxID=3108223 RepID=A0ABU8XUL9_9PROT